MLTRQFACLIMISAVVAPGVKADEAETPRRPLAEVIESWFHLQHPPPPGALSALMERYGASREEVETILLGFIDEAEQGLRERPDDRRSNRVLKSAAGRLSAVAGERGVERLRKLFADYEGKNARYVPEDEWELFHRGILYEANTRRSILRSLTRALGPDAVELGHEVLADREDEERFPRLDRLPFYDTFARSTRAQLEEDPEGEAARNMVRFLHEALELETHPSMTAALDRRLAELDSEYRESDARRRLLNDALEAGAAGGARMYIREQLGLPEDENR